MRLNVLTFCRFDFSLYHNPSLCACDPNESLAVFHLTDDDILKFASGCDGNQSFHYCSPNPFV